MCNIAGYVGSRPAAPILIDMMRREEGWNAGYYTGIATLHEGKIYYAKLMGDLGHLLENTDAASLPGNIGILHGRTPDDGTDQWAHPHIGIKDGQALTAYVANGFSGCFAHLKPRRVQIAEQLKQEGHTFLSRTERSIRDYLPQPDGTTVHPCDTMAQLITHKILQGADTSAAMDQAFCEMPGQYVGLLLSLAAQDCITWSRTDMPMFVGFCEHGAYLASTPLAFPQDAGEPTLLPSCSGGQVFPDRFTAAPYKNPPARVAPITARVWSEGYAAIVEQLKKGYHTIHELVPVVKPLFDKADCSPNASVIYSTLYSLQKQGLLDVQVTRLPGLREGLTAPLFKAGLKG